MGVANECIPFYEEGQRITVHASSAITGKRFLKISGNRQSGPGLAATADGSNYIAAHADAAGRSLGVSSHDIPSGKKGTAICTPGIVLPVTAVGAIAAFAEVEVGNAGRAATKSGGVAVGVAMTAANDGTDAEIKLY